MFKLVGTQVLSNTLAGGVLLIEWWLGRTVWRFPIYERRLSPGGHLCLVRRFVLDAQFVFYLEHA